MPEKINYVTGSRSLDSLAFLLILIVILAGSYYLRVYYAVTAAEFNLVYISPGGSRQKLDLPLGNKIPASISKSTPKLLDFIEERAKKYIGGSGMYTNYLLKNPGARIELNIYYSQNSTKLDKKKVIVFDESSSF